MLLLIFPRPKIRGLGPVEILYYQSQRVLGKSYALLLVYPGKGFESIFREMTLHDLGSWNNNTTSSR